MTIRIGVPLRRALKTLTLINLATVQLALAQPTPPGASTQYEFQNGYPSPATISQVYDEIDLNRAVQAYRFFYPNVSMMNLWQANIEDGMQPNQVFALMQGSPAKRAFTANSDTPYAGAPIDLSAGPMVVEFPPGPLMSVANDLNQSWIMDLGVPGPDAGKGGKHLILPPEYNGPVPEGYFIGRSTTNKLLLLLRALPIKGDIEGAIALMKSVKVYPLNNSADWVAPSWVNLSEHAVDLTPVKLEDNLQYWRTLHTLLDSEPANPAYSNYYGELAALGIAKDKPFEPDARMQRILIEAAKKGMVQMRVQSFADRRPDRVVWPDRQWEWAVLRPENGTFSTGGYTDLQAREKWFFQAMIASPAMFRRAPGAGSLYWLGSRDAQGQYLDGAKAYTLSVPLPLPAKLFWSVTVYDSQTRSQIETPQAKAALRSLEELKGQGHTGTAQLYFGPTPPPGKEQNWIKTTPGKGWFAYFRIYGPDKPAFDGAWKPGDFNPVN
ncbi:MULTISPECIES: DUF1254 domain-containing protein [Pseudomonas]|uniref:DUF1254 domain-containing protein n=1 Tax=Pseudomonas auratipiscis TaxID=3115853 RepID=A0AB35WPE4_9PSED|nr:MULTISPECIES: DUF1254 domain-containing protein [unclassified Pseudomonas]MEE1865089.1 DUF1254 domain-containing protein [Pseudomonas sp. 120P]MEE1955970.1 DUF1254 domain-containing protein [Pseudomonas sp. 119P]